MAERLPYGLVPSSSTWRKSGVSRTGGRTLTGRQQVIRSDAGFWVASASFTIPMRGNRGEDRTLAYRGLMASLDGMAGEILLPVFARFRPYDMNGSMLATTSMASGPLYNHMGWATEEPQLMFAASGVARGVSKMTINHPGVDGLRAGHYFGIGERVYIVSNAWTLDYEYPEAIGGVLTFGGAPLTFGGDVLDYGTEGTVIRGANVQALEFWPRLREPIAAGTPLILGQPVCRMRLASDETGILDQGMSSFSSVTLDFEEVI